LFPEWQFILSVPNLWEDFQNLRTGATQFEGEFQILEGIPAGYAPFANNKE